MRSSPDTIPQTRYARGEYNIAITKRPSDAIAEPVYTIGPRPAASATVHPSARSEATTAPRVTGAGSSVAIATPPPTTPRAKGTSNWPRAMTGATATPVNEQPVAVHILAVTKKHVKFIVNGETVTMLRSDALALASTIVAAIG